MKLNKHLAFHLLLNEKFCWQIVNEMYPETKGNYKEVLERISKEENAAKYYEIDSCFQTVMPFKQKAYYITETVIDKLDMLKVDRNCMAEIREKNKPDIIGTETTFNWSIFNFIKTGTKVTFILPDGRIVRMRVLDNMIHFLTFSSKVLFGEGKIDNTFDFFFYDKKNETVSTNWHEMRKYDELIFKILCFFYLSENTEVVVPPGQSHGTRKSGKVLNDTPVPVTIVNSNWNVTSVRTEGFDVSGHFRLQPTKTGVKMIFINPFRKHGYIRHAKNESEPL